MECTLGMYRSQKRCIQSKLSGDDVLYKCSIQFSPKKMNGKSKHNFFLHGAHVPSFVYIHILFLRRPAHAHKKRSHGKTNVHKKHIHTSIYINICLHFLLDHKKKSTTKKSASCAPTIHIDIYMRKKGSLFFFLCSFFVSLGSLLLGRHSL